LRTLLFFTCAPIATTLPSVRLRASVTVPPAVFYYGLHQFASVSPARRSTADCVQFRRYRLPFDIRFATVRLCGMLYKIDFQQVKPHANACISAIFNRPRPVPTLPPAVRLCGMPFDVVASVGRWVDVKIILYYH
jgi:hypothetical protein